MICFHGLSLYVPDKYYILHVKDCFLPDITFVKMGISIYHIFVLLNNKPKKY